MEEGRFDCENMGILFLLAWYFLGLLGSSVGFGMANNGVLGGFGAIDAE
jgi:hypothetical protein